MEKTDVGAENSLDCYKRVVKPFRLRSEIGRPSIGGGEKECPTRADQLGYNLFEKSLRFRKSVDQVGGQHEVEGAKLFRDSKGIAG